MVGKSYCPYTRRARAALQQLGVRFASLDLDTPSGGGDAMQEAFATRAGRRTVPMVFIGGECAGGCDETLAAIKDGSMQARLERAGVAHE